MLRWLRLEARVADFCPLTLAEARAILIANEALDLSFVARGGCGKTFGIEELGAWLKLVESANARIAAYAGHGAPSMEAAAPLSAYPGGNEPDFQTLFVEAVASSEMRRKTP